jgi:hypothetical protein
MGAPWQTTIKNGKVTAIDLTATNIDNDSAAPY